MARSVRKAQRSVEPCAISRLLFSVVYVMQQEAPLEAGIVITGSLATPTPFTIEAPHYDALLRELWYLDVLIKKLKSNAENQDKCFTCWQEQNWEGPLYDPLPPKEDIDPLKRFADTVHSMNKHHANPGWLGFKLEGAEQVVWTPGDKAIARLAQRRPARLLA